MNGKTYDDRQMRLKEKVKISHNDKTQNKTVSNFIGIANTWEVEVIKVNKVVETC